MNEMYLGDSVYVDFDGHRLILWTDNGYGPSDTNRIVLEPEVYFALVEYVTRLKTPQNQETA